MIIVFWICLAIVVFTYLGYGLVVWGLLKLRGKKPLSAAYSSDEELPEVTLLVAVYNEEDILTAKIENCNNIDYPKDKLTLLFVTDGSTDRSAEILAGHDNITLLHSPERRGKIAAVARSMKQITTPFTVLTDANTLLNSEVIRVLTRHFRDPQVGAVAGEKRVFSTGDASSGGEGLYWKYESFLKKQDSNLHSVVGAAGELYAIRTHLFQEVPEDTILDDFMQTLLIAKAGYRVTYAPDAIAEEHASANVKEELKRKIRICAGGFQSMRRLLPLLNIFKYGMLSFQYIGHRVLRWSIAPIALVLVFLLNAILAAQIGGFYGVLFAGQVCFYLFALMGYLLRNKTVPVPGFFAPYYFCVMNYSVAAGFKRYLNNEQKAMWEKAKRVSV